MIPVRLVVLGVTLAVDLIREIPRAVRRGRERKRAEEPVRPADELPLSPVEEELAAWEAWQRSLRLAPDFDPDAERARDDARPLPSGEAIGNAIREGSAIAAERRRWPRVG